MTGAPIPLSRVARRAPLLLRWFGAAHAAVLGAGDGRLATRWFGAEVLVLETVGRRTGAVRRTPLVYLPDADGGGLVVVAAGAGASCRPAWWLNLQAGGGDAHVAGRRWCVRARQTMGAERERLWRRHAAVTPVEHYERVAGRSLPVVVLEHAGPERGLSSPAMPPSRPSPARRPFRSGPRPLAA